MEDCLTIILLIQIDTLLSQPVLRIVAGHVRIPKVCQMPHKRGKLHYKTPTLLEIISSFDM